MEQLDATIEKITYHDERSGYTVARVSRDNQINAAPTTIVGKFAQIHAGENYLLKGRWIEHYRYGRQFQVDSYQSKKPNTLDGIERYLGSGLIKGVGPSLAKRIVEKFGLLTLEVMEKTPEALKNISGIGRQKYQSIRESWQAHHEVQELMIFLQEHGITTQFALKIHKVYGKRAMEVVQENPYRLAKDIYGVGFKKSDELALKLGLEKDSPKRVQALLLHLVTQQEAFGHGYTDWELLVSEAEAYLGWSDPQIFQMCLDQAILIGDLVKVVEHKAVTTSQAFLAQRFLTKRLLDFSNQQKTVNTDSVETWLQSFESKNQIRFADNQKKAFIEASVKPFVIITGGPGTGKTTLVRAIVDYHQSKNQKIALVSPTGRAAQRMSEQTKFSAQTIHRLLEFEPKSRQFRFNANNPIPFDVLVVDETSMLDIYLAQSLFQAVGSNTQVILIGDADQLPSVGPGQLLKDMLDRLKLPQVQLDQTYRQEKGSHIIRAANNIRLHENLEMDSGFTPEKDFYWFGGSEPSHVVDDMMKLVFKYLPERFGFDPVQDIQVLTPMNRGELGTFELNELIQDSICKQKKLTKGRLGFAVGDKVIQRVNNYDKEVFNGDLGFVQSIDEEDQIVSVAFERPEGIFVVPYELTELAEISLAYAISIHKSQGSEFPCVVIPIHTQHFMMLNPNLIYTAVTRGKRCVILLGPKRAYQIACQRADSLERRSLIGLIS